MTSDNNNNTAQTPPPAKRVKLDETIAQDITGPVTTTMNTMAPPPLMVKKLSEKARLPTRGSAFAAGYDIYASKATVIPARGKALVDTDISMACPAGTCTSARSLVCVFFNSLHSFHPHYPLLPPLPHLCLKLTLRSQTAASPLAPALPPSKPGQ